MSIQLTQSPVSAEKKKKVNISADEEQDKEEEIRKKIMIKKTARKSREFSTRQ